MSSFQRVLCAGFYGVGTIREFLTLASMELGPEDVSPLERCYHFLLVPEKVF